MTGEKLLRIIGEIEDSDIELSESLKGKKRRTGAWLSVAAAALLLAGGAFLVSHFLNKDGKNGEHTAYVPTSAPTSAPTANATEEVTEPPVNTIGPIDTMSPEPPMDFDAWTYLAYGTPVFGKYFTSEEEFALAYARGGEGSHRFSELYSMTGGEYYFAPKRLPEGAKLELIMPASDSVALVYLLSGEGMKYSFEWLVKADAEEYEEWLEAFSSVYTKDGEYWISNEASAPGVSGYREVYLIREGMVFYSVLPAQWLNDEIIAYMEPEMVMLPDPDPACANEVRFASVEDCLAAIRANTSKESVLAGLEGVYVLKDCDLPITGITVTRETVTVRYNGSEPQRASLKLNRALDPNMDPESSWLIEIKRYEPDHRIEVMLDEALEVCGMIVYSDDDAEEGVGQELAIEAAKVEFLPALVP